MNPFKYRPEHLVHDPELPEAPDEIEWADNWASNFIAYVSQFWPLEPMCNEEHYLSSRIANYFFTSCPCCLFWRSIILGYILGGLVGLAAGLAIGLWTFGPVI